MDAMFGLRPKMPVTEEERVWVDEGFQRLEAMLGRSRMERTTVVLPSDAFFPDHWDGTESALEALFCRVCGYMGVDRSQIELAVSSDDAELLEMLPAYSIHGQNNPAGLQFGSHGEERALIVVRSSLLKDTLALVATLAHELCHVILLDGGLQQRDSEDMEPMTDLATVYLGLGVFTANASRQFRQYQLPQVELF